MSIIPIWSDPVCRVCLSFAPTWLRSAYWARVCRMDTAATRCTALAIVLPRSDRRRCAAQASLRGWFFRRAGTKLVHRMIQHRRHCESSVLGLKAVASSLRWTKALRCLWDALLARMAVFLCAVPSNPNGLLLLHTPWCQDSACLLHVEPRETESCCLGTSFRVPARLSHCARANQICSTRAHATCVHTY